MRHGTETWEEVLCGREETDERILWVMAGKNKEVTAAGWEPALGVFRGSLRAPSAG